MKYIQAFASATVFAALLTFSANASAQSTRPGIATIVRMHGHARYSSDGTTWRTLALGQVLGPSDVIQSGVDSTVDIVLSDRDANLSSQLLAQPPVKTPEQMAR